jgi:hypothetical protein
LLVDTNVFLELLLAQARAQEAAVFLQSTMTRELFVTDYAVHSIGLILFRRNQPETFRQFLADMRAAMIMVSLTSDDLEGVIDTASTFRLDFDDAYQYQAASKYGLTIVSFDTDFDRTPLGRKTPAAVS